MGTCILKLRDNEVPAVLTMTKPFGKAVILHHIRNFVFQWTAQRFDNSVTNLGQAKASRFGCKVHVYTSSNV